MPTGADQNAMFDLRGLASKVFQAGDGDRRPMVSAPFFRCLGLDARPNLSQVPPRRRLVLELGQEPTIGGDQRGGAAHDEGDLVIAVTLVGQECHMCEHSDVVCYGTKGVVELAGDLIGLQPLEVETRGVDTVSLAGADILLLATAGNP